MGFHLRYAEVRNCLGDSRPDLASELVGKSPYKILENSSQRLLWQCSKCFQRFSARVVDRNKGGGCPYCSGRRILPGKTDLQTTHPELASELFECDGKTISRGSNKRVQWKCSTCWNVWTATPNARVNGKGCSMCCKRGFQDSKPGYVYLLGRGIDLKIGITNNPKFRIEKQHFANGWKLLDITIQMPGIFARRIETAIKNGLKFSGIRTGKSIFAEPFDGWTEAWCAIELHVESIPELLSKLSINSKNSLSFFNVNHIRKVADIG